MRYRLIAIFALWGFVNTLQAQLPEQGYLGAQIDETPVVGQGVLVRSVRSPSPAEAGGLMKFDVITAVNDKPCRNVADFRAVMRMSPAGSKLTAEVTRAGKTEIVVVTLGKLPPPPPAPKLPVRRQPPSPDEN